MAAPPSYNQMFGGGVAPAASLHRMSNPFGGNMEYASVSPAQGQLYPSAFEGASASAGGVGAPPVIRDGIAFTSGEDAMFEDLADLAATLKAIELLEVGKANRSVSARVHLQECTRLIEQYKQLEAGLLRDGSIASRDDFIKRYNVTARRALQRIDEGIAVPQVNRASPAVEVSLHWVSAQRPSRSPPE